MPDSDVQPCQGDFACLLVTGGAGFIGSNFVRFVLREHRLPHIVVFDKFTYAANLKSLSGVDLERLDIVEGDICDVAQVEQVITDYGVDAIVNFAAESHNDNAICDPAPFISTNVVGTYVLLEAARRHNLRFHQVSTDEVYGDLALDDSSRFTERSPYRPSGPYAASKAAADHLVRAWHRTYGSRVTISNSSNNYGPRQHVEKFIPRQITNILCGVRPKLYGDGRAVRDWIAVEDNCTAIWEVLTRGEIGRTYLIGADGERSNIQVLRMILERMGRPVDEFDWVRDRPGADRRYALNASGIRDQLGWRPRCADFAVGLDETIAWYRDHADWWMPSKAETEDKYQREGH
ncbi:dTDP-glucose 4,6-dehydratase [Bifidobacterium actinocoloniiforme DSM 22766]|uniref:dTDP-glucose 4,6-dehydratase n=1 Tax=Bifidobacterium actinocoloniiforme DSM 22766 TaxID=1437605 RepID=A0A086Z1X3_9BIFI|nr:dTDP-glucose 4,6-dehydratase [Bifidobacterium actinocoloniiforme]AKV55621.1 dTDP-glucose 4,6-dehydratase [Bifidobacterium actinocoloniiforme DSM 22766]KFI40523.1 dTDP-glucose 4,6-dehydratase [Bifidobacterium actinocoloniiforme DSM 22766]